MSFKLKHFIPQEFVPKVIFNMRGGKALQLMDREILVFIDTLREVLGKRITVNNWHVGGGFSQRGLRTSASKHFKQFSQHTYGKALDFDVEDMTADEVRQWLVEHRNLDWVSPISFIEDGCSWVHVDTRPTKDDALILWHYKTGKVKCY